MSTPSPETHVFVGMFRPTKEAIWSDIAARHTARMNRVKAEGNEAYKIPDPLQCPVCRSDFLSHGYGQVGDGEKRFHDCYVMGHFDEPVYKTIEEVVRMRRDDPAAIFPTVP